MYEPLTLQSSFRCLASVCGNQKMGIRRLYIPTLPHARCGGLGTFASYPRQSYLKGLCSQLSTS